MKKYTYNHWWSGKICLYSSAVFYNSEDKVQPNQKNWDDIDENGIIKIKAKQTELFKEQVSEKLTSLKHHFKKRYENSKRANSFLDEEIDKVGHLMFGKFPIQEQVILWEYDGLVFNDFDLDRIQKHVDRYINKGKTLEYDFMHSPNYPFQKKEIPLQIYSEALWQYSVWLTNFRAEINKKPEKKDELEKKNEPENPYSDIFKNGYAYELFQELEGSTVNEGTEIADFSFIFHKLKNRNLEAIRSTVSQINFIDFINQSGNYCILTSRLNYKNQKHKQRAYKKLIDKYGDDIIKTPQTARTFNKIPQK